MGFTTSYCSVRFRILKLPAFFLAALVLASCGTTGTKDNKTNLADASDPLSTQSLSTVEPTNTTTTHDLKLPDRPLNTSAYAIEGSDNSTNRLDKALAVAKLTIIAPEETQPAQIDLWQEIRNGFSFSDKLPTASQFNKNRSYKTPEQRVERYRKRLLASPSAIYNITENAEPYLYFVVNELKANNIPLEIALLPIVESRYDPFAYSPGRASGLWQFIPATGRNYGLHQDWWQDKRRDTVLATRSAITYLSSLHKRFDNDWLLAMAAYNAGQGNVAKAIRKNKRLGKPTDYWSLDLPKETEHYIPKLLAWRDIIKHADRYAIDLKAIANEPHFTLVNIGSQIDLAEAAALADVDIDTIYNLNGSYNRWATDPEAPHLLAVPVDNAAILEEKLVNFTSDQRLSWQRYIIQPNDSLIKIGNKFNTSPKLIARVNNIKNNRIQAGKALLIPSAAKASEFYRLSEDQRLNRRQNSAPKNKTQQIEHKVINGESLWDIAKHYNVGVNELARWNSMAPGDILALNKKLVIWSKKTPIKKASNEKRTVFYTVRKGDSLAYIASRFKVRVRDIQDWNNNTNSKYIQPGQLIKLFVDITNRRSFN
jgi:membrane-bound lytic murein transglycosylase D